MLRSLKDFISASFLEVQPVQNAAEICRFSYFRFRQTMFGLLIVLLYWLHNSRQIIGPLAAPGLSCKVG